MRLGGIWAQPRQEAGQKQFSYGLLAQDEGCPVPIEVFAGNQTDAKPLEAPIARLHERYGFRRVVFVGDRGRITTTRIADLQAVGYDGMTALRARDIQRLYAADAFPLSRFDERDLVAIEHPDYPGERLGVCRNPPVAEDRRRTRDELVAATERDLEKIRQRVAAGRLRDAEKIGLAVGNVIDQHKMAKHFRLERAEGVFRYTRDAERIAQEAQWDGLYIVRTSVPGDDLDMADVIATYHGLQQVEQAFRNMKTMHRDLRPYFIGWKTETGRMGSCACWPTTCNGT